ncbi:alanine:cation symporter family protein, partial [Campylobacter coli]
LSDLFNGLMVIPNLIAVLILSPIVVKLLKDYNDKKDYDVKDYIRYGKQNSL